MRTIYNPSTIEAATEAKLWQDAIIVFDTCALLNFYYMTPDHQEVMADILKYLADRIWLPAQVVYEYKKNRESVITKPIAENYREKELKNNHLVDDLKSFIAQWERDYYHPFISKQSLNSIKDALAIIEPKISEIKTTVSREYQARRNEIKDLKDNDVIEKAVNTLVQGQPFTFSELMTICKEGAFRYANQIPPGYKDAETKEGIRQYGDLIIWKEILQHAKQQKCDIIFVTNDVKPDWSMVYEEKYEQKEEREDKSSKLKEEKKCKRTAEKPLLEEIGNPRRELLAEFEEETKQSIWFYSSSGFISKLESTYQPKQKEIAFYGQLGIVRDVLARQERERMVRKRFTGEGIIIRCDNCGELFSFDADDMYFEWEGGVVDEDRGMGCEMEYESHETCNCPNCNSQIDLTLQVWEYPVGAFNYQNIDIDGGEVDSPINLEKYIDLGDYDTCERCGERAILNSCGLCEQCEEEFNRFVNSDD